MRPACLHVRTLPQHVADRLGQDGVGDPFEHDLPSWLSCARSWAVVISYTSAGARSVSCLGWRSARTAVPAEATPQAYERVLLLVPGRFTRRHLCGLSSNSCMLIALDPWTAIPAVQ